MRLRRWIAGLLLMAALQGTARVAYEKKPESIKATVTGATYSASVLHDKERIRLHSRKDNGKYCVQAAYEQTPAGIRRSCLWSGLGLEGLIYSEENANKNYSMHLYTKFRLGVNNYSLGMVNQNGCLSFYSSPIVI